MDDKYIKEYYERYDEEGRLTSKHQRIEFLTTVKYVEKYATKESKILEVGAGTGRYSLYFSRAGYHVEAVELVPHNIDIFKSKMTPEEDITIHHGNALDLHMYEDNTFDITLVLGPMYHMYTKEDKNKVVKEAIRVTKKGGLIYIAYISHDSVIVSWGLLNSQLVYGQEQHMFTDDYRCISEPKDLFAMMDLKEIKELMKNHNIEHVHTVGTDGISPWFRELFKGMDEKEYEEWLKYHFISCEREDLIGYSNHVLYIGKKV